MIGYLSPEESLYAFSMTDKIKGRILTLSSTGDKQDISLNISKNKTNISYTFNDLPVMHIQTETTVFLTEIPEHGIETDEEVLRGIEKTASQMLQENILQTVQKVQREYHSDIFGFGERIYKKDPVLWRQLEPDWETLFTAMRVEVACQVHIVNTESSKIA